MKSTTQLATQACHYYEIRRDTKKVTKSCGCITITNTKISREFL